MGMMRKGKESPTAAVAAGLSSPLYILTGPAISIDCRNIFPGAFLFQLTINFLSFCSFLPPPVAAEIPRYT